MPICPACGSPHVPCPDCDAEEQIAAWIGGPSTFDPHSGDSDRSCTACGFAGEMALAGNAATCPACGVTLPARRASVDARVVRSIECPECGREIGITAEDEGKTVICPGCSYFLGTPMAKPGAGRVR